MRPGTVTEFAKERGVSRARVYQWLEEKRIERLEDGNIDFDDANGRLDATLDQAKGMRRSGNITSSAPSLPLDERSVPSAAAAPAAGPSTQRSDAGDGARQAPNSSSDYWAHKTESEKYDALQKKARFLQTAGALTSAEDVRRERIETARAVRNALLAMIDRVAPVLDPGNPARAHRLLTGEVQKALHELRDGLETRARGADAAPGELAPALQ